MNECMNGLLTDWPIDWLIYILTDEGDNKLNQIPYFVKFFEKINISISTLSLVLLFCIFFILTGLLKSSTDFFISKLRKKIVTSYLKNSLNKFFNSDWHFFYHTKISKISSAIYKDLEIISGSVAAGLHIFSNVSIIIIFWSFKRSCWFSLKRLYFGSKIATWVWYDHKI